MYFIYFQQQPSTSSHRSTSPGPSSALSPYANTRHYRCQRCQHSFPNRSDFYRHLMRHHVQQGGGYLQPSPYMQGEEPWIGDEALREVYEINAPHILRRHQEGPVTSIYNVPLTNDFSIFELMEAMEDIYDRQQHAFRLHLHFGLILRNIIFHTQMNSCFLDQSIYPDAVTWKNSENDYDDLICLTTSYNNALIPYGSQC